jgi:hypothetical protein
MKSPTRLLNFRAMLELRIDILYPLGRDTDIDAVGL